MNRYKKELALIACVMILGCANPYKVKDLDESKIDRDRKSVV